MHRTPVFVPVLVLLLVVSILIAGCSSPDTPNQTAQPDTSVTSAAAQYAAGDIVRNPKSGSELAWLVIRYDPASDTYERALIYKNADGSWGYRSDDRTEKTSRSVMDKVYTEKIATRNPSLVPVVTPTIITPVETVRPTSAVTTGTTTNTATLTPTVERSIPDSGYAGTTVKITDLVGNNFVKGAEVSLSRNNYTSIPATNVTVLSLKSITCTFVIPADAPVGTWDLNVKNPNGLSGSYANYFTVNRDTSVVTTTQSDSAGTLPITYIDPPQGFSGKYDKFTITGSKFQTGAKVTLRSTFGRPDIVATNVVFDSPTQLTCFFSIPTSSFGDWDLIVTNPDGTWGAKLAGFRVN